MKKQGVILFCIMIWVLPTRAQVFSFSMDNNSTNPILIPDGEVWQLQNYSWSKAGGPPVDGILICATTNLASWIGKLPNNELNINSIQGAVFVGPVHIMITTNVLNYYLAFKKIESVPLVPTSPSAVVIPQLTSGDVDIKVEQSADNVTWTECLPGTYNSSTVKRFFRLRAVEK